MRQAQLNAVIAGAIAEVRKVTDDEIIDALISEPASLSPLKAIETVVQLCGSRITQFEAIKYLKFAYPEVPLDTLIHASTSRLIVGDRGLGDDELTELLSRFFPRGNGGP